jgi:hypothetical protein
MSAVSMAEVGCCLGRPGVTSFSVASTSGRCYLEPAPAEWPKQIPSLATRASSAKLQRGAALDGSEGHCLISREGLDLLAGSGRHGRSMQRESLRRIRSAGRAHHSEAGPPSTRVLQEVHTLAGKPGLYCGREGAIRKRAVACQVATSTRPVEEDFYQEDGGNIAPPISKAAVVKGSRPGPWQKVVDTVKRGLDLNEWVLRDFRKMVAAVRAWEGQMAGLTGKPPQSVTFNHRFPLGMVYR